MSEPLTLADFDARGVETLNGVGTKRAEALGHLGIRTLLAFVFSHNDPSIRSFQRAGFEPWGQLPTVAELDGNWRDLSILGLKVGVE